MLKQALTSSPVMQHSNSDLHFTVHTDSSETGLSTLLMKDVDKDENLVLEACCCWERAHHHKMDHQKTLLMSCQVITSLWWLTRLLYSGWLYNCEKTITTLCTYIIHSFTIHLASLYIWGGGQSITGCHVILRYQFIYQHVYGTVKRNWRTHRKARPAFSLKKKIPLVKLLSGTKDI